MFFISLVLENLCLSTVDNEDLIYCTKVSLFEHEFKFRLPFWLIHVEKDKKRTLQLVVLLLSCISNLLQSIIQIFHPLFSFDVNGVQFSILVFCSCQRTGTVRANCTNPMMVSGLYKQRPFLIDYNQYLLRGLSVTRRRSSPVQNISAICLVFRNRRYDIGV